MRIRKAGLGRQEQTGHRLRGGGKEKSNRNKKKKEIKIA